MPMQRKKFQKGRKDNDSHVYAVIDDTMVYGHLLQDASGPFIQAEKSLEVPFRGSKNQRILDVPKSLAAGQAIAITSMRWLGEY